MRTVDVWNSLCCPADAATKQKHKMLLNSLCIFGFSDSPSIILQSATQEIRCSWKLALCCPLSALEEREA